MKGPEATMINGNLYFKNFMVQKESETFYGVYESFCNSKTGKLITSGKTMQSAAKKAKLLQIGYNMCKEYETEINSLTFSKMLFNP